MTSHRTSDPSPARERTPGGPTTLGRSFLMASIGATLASILVAQSGTSDVAPIVALGVWGAWSIAVALLTGPFGGSRILEGWCGLMGAVVVGAAVAWLTMPGWPPQGDFVLIGPPVWAGLVAVAETAVGTLGYVVGGLIVYGTRPRD